MTQYLNYLVLNDNVGIERVSSMDCDASEQAGIIDRTLLPVLQTGKGWMDSRTSGYTVSGIIQSNAASFLLLDDGALIGWLAVSLHSKTSKRMWDWIVNGDQFDVMPPAAPWAILREHAAAWVQPEWINNWAKHVGYALMTREGW